ncbi:MAG: sugar-binding domain-containing protein [Candidatus Omnitrophota bacterium]
MNTILNGKWEFQWAPVTSQISISGLDLNWLPAKVPGDVHLDMMANGLLKEPLNGLASFEAENIEDRVWFYRKIIDFKRPTEIFLARLVFEGLDCVADIYLNSKHLGKTENAFVPHTFDVTDLLANGQNTILIKISNGLETIASKELARYLAKEKAFHRIWLRKPQFSFGWDWAPRLITCGIWRDVRLEVTTAGFIDDVFAKPILSRGAKRANVKYSFEFIPASIASLSAEATVRILDNNRTVTCHKVKLKKGTVRDKLVVQNPQLWWPAGEGNQKLYELEITVPGREENTVCRTKFGIRRLRVVEKFVKEGGKTFAFEVNGKIVFCRGANWVPADSIVARVDNAKIDTLLEEAICCNFNMLRVWGGGIYEGRHFYQRCDELGIMIWQDFMYACALYPDDDEVFLKNCASETVKIIKLLRNHPCIVLWCGENEIHDAYFDVYQPGGANHLYGSKIWDEVIPDALRRLAKGAIYRPASPWGGSYARSETEGDSHNLGVNLTQEEATDIHMATHSVGRFMSEFYTWTSPPDMVSMKRFLPDDQLYLGSKAYIHHANTMFESREKMGATRYITKNPEGLPMEIYIHATQRLHGQHMAALVDAYRRNLSICGGVLFWMYNDCWPTSSWTTHDYYVRRKALFYYIKRAFAPVTVFYKEEDSALSVWVSNLSNYKFSGSIRYGRYGFSEGNARCEYKKKIVVQSRASIKIGFFYTTLTWPWENLASFAYASLKDTEGKTVAKASRLFSSCKGLSGEEFHFSPNYWAHKSLQSPQIHVDSVSKNSVKVLTDVPAFSVHVEADEYLPDDNFFDLMPWEEKVVRFAKEIPNIDIKVNTLNDVILFLRDNFRKDTQK